MLATSESVIGQSRQPDEQAAAAAAAAVAVAVAAGDAQQAICGAWQRLPLIRCRQYLLSTYLIYSSMACLLVMPAAQAAAAFVESTSTLPGRSVHHVKSSRQISDLSSLAGVQHHSLELLIPYPAVLLRGMHSDCQSGSQFQNVQK
jgi:hypothetical protein